MKKNAFSNDELHEALKDDPVKHARFAELRELVRTEQSSIDESSEFVKLKQDAAMQINEQARAENLKFLRDGDYSAEEILRAAGCSKKDVLAAIKVLFDEDASEPIPGLLTIKIESEVISVGGGRWTKAISDIVSGMNPEQLAASLTPEGKAYLSETKLIQRGNRAGQHIYPNAEYFAKRIGMNQDDLVTAIISLQ